MKKIIGVLLVLVMLGTLLSCNGNGAGEQTEYVFVSGQTSVAINSEAQAVLDSLGTWKQYSESPSCAFDGLDKVYVYSGFRIQTYPQNGQDYIYSVELTDDSVTTPEGITIGSARDQVVTAYGDASTESETSLVYFSTDRAVKLQILLRDGRVSNIQYLRVEQ